MKGIIVYKGRYGATKQYAQWLGTSLHIPVIETEHMTDKNMADYDYIIIGSSVYIGKLQVREWIKRHEAVLRNRKVYFFIVCATPASEKEKIAEIVDGNIPQSLRQGNDIYILRGRMIKKNLSWLDGFMLKMGASLQKNAADRNNMLQDFDEVKPENLKGIIKGVQASMLV
jgi:menaquinone-dependent protoporphyrinogen IX oxidase